MSYDLFQPFTEMKQQGLWPVPWTSGMGLVPVIKSLESDSLVGCELGVSFGINLIYTLDNIDKITKVYAVDPYQTYDDRVAGGEIVSTETIERVHDCFLVNSQPYRDKIQLIRKTSDQAHLDIPDDSLDYIFIDGDHNYAQTLRDIRNYYPKVKSGGIFAGHDIHLQDVTRALTEFILEIGLDLDKLRLCDHQTWYWVK